MGVPEGVPPRTHILLNHTAGAHCASVYYVLCWYIVCNEFGILVQMTRPMHVLRMPGLLRMASDSGNSMRQVAPGIFTFVAGSPRWANVQLHWLPRERPPGLTYCSTVYATVTGGDHAIMMASQGGYSRTFCRAVYVFFGCICMHCRLAINSIM